MGKAIATDNKTIIDLARSAGDEIRIEYVKISELAGYFLEGNSKKHDIGGLVTKFEKYGFVEPIKIDPSLNNGSGGIVGGNGRLEALLQMFESGEEPPRGIKTDGDQCWYAPVAIGVNARSEREAIALSIDLNWSILEGGDFTALDGTRLFDSEALLAQLQDLADNGEMVTAIDGDDLDFLIEQLESIDNELNFEGADRIPPEPDDEPRERSSGKKKGIDCPNCGFHFAS